VAFPSDGQATKLVKQGDALVGARGENVAYWVATAVRSGC